jgi:hypothetical protein
MVHDLLLERRDLRQRSHAGFVGYQDAVFSYPFFDKRMVEFALAADGQFKYRNGQSRFLLRLGMEGRLPAEILTRTSKAPFVPDYHLRYESQKSKALGLLEGFSGSGRLNEIVDFQRVFGVLATKAAYDTQNPMHGDHDAQFTVPYAAYLCYFLSTFGS